MNGNDRKIAAAALIVGMSALAGVFFLGDRDGLPRGDSPSVGDTAGTERDTYYAQPVRKVEEFAFDPNTADSTQLLRLGLKPWHVRNIYRYRAAGGVFRQKEDFARLYGLTAKDYRRLAPYIRISDDYQPASMLVGERKRAEPRDSARFPVKIQADEHIVLNTADTAELKRVPGIGSYYAREIVRYGQWLGGYVSVDQLDEIDGFPAEAKKYFVIKAPEPRKLNVNQLSVAQLRRHPYINYYMAKTIVDYRRLHGPIRSLQDLRLSRDFPPSVIARLEPYVTY